MPSQTAPRKKPARKEKLAQKRKVRQKRQVQKEKPAQKGKVRQKEKLAQKRQVQKKKPAVTITQEPEPAGVMKKPAQQVMLESFGAQGGRPTRMYDRQSQFVGPRGGVLQQRPSD
jgi:hypothetical protein